MSLTLTYLGDLSRVRIAGGELAADAVRVERSIDGGPWEPVRGGVSAAPAAGVIQLDDYEFGSDVTNAYRVVDVDDDAVLESDSITPSLAGTVWLKHIRYPLLNRPVFRILDRGQAFGRSARGSLSHIAGRSLPVSTSDLATSRGFPLTVQARDASDAAVLDLMLAAGGVLFVHVPPDLTDKVPGGYVRVAGSEQARRSTLERWAFDLACTAVAPPSPRIVGTTLTWETVRRLYGSWNALWASSSTWRDLWNEIGDPSDVVTL